MGLRRWWRERRGPRSFKVSRRTWRWAKAWDAEPAEDSPALRAFLASPQLRDAAQREPRVIPGLKQLMDCQPATVTISDLSFGPSTYIVPDVTAVGEYRCPACNSWAAFPTGTLPVTSTLWQCACGNWIELTAAVS